MMDRFGPDDGVIQRMQAILERGTDRNPIADAIWRVVKKFSVKGYILSI